jgi:hypothetical protein
MWSFVARPAETEAKESVLLSVGEYAAAECTGMARLPNRIIECSRAVTFAHEGYPATAHNTEAVGRYVDVMHEGRTQATFDQFLSSAITEEEFELVRKVTEAVARLSETVYGQRRVATGSLLRALNVYRQINILYPKDDTTILEIGHGSGYLGALLASSGYGYASMDIAQGFYLFQNHLLTTLLGSERVTELATDDRPLDTFNRVAAGFALHIPWWKFFVPEPRPSLRVNVVTCNHALAEMHVNALSYIVKTARLMLTKTNGAFLFEGWGSTVLRPIWSVSKRFADFGYVIAHNDIWASVFAPLECPAAKDGLTLPRPCRNDAAIDVGHYPEAAFTAMFHPPIYSNPNNPISTKLTQGRQAIAAKAKRTLADVEAMWREYLGQSDIISDDERFGRFIERSGCY